MIDIFQKYMGTGLILIWFVLALVYLFLHEKRKPYRILLIYVPALVLLVFFNPVFHRVFEKLVGDEIYFRLVWLLPIAVVIGYTVVLICNSLKGVKRTVFAVTAVLILVISGKLVYKNPLFTKAENVYHVPQTVVEICDAIEVKGREVMAAFPAEFLLYVRQYSPLVCMPYGREVFGYHDELYGAIMSEEPDVEKLAALAKKALCHYVILHEGKVNETQMEQYSYELFAVIDGYEVYKDNTMYFGLDQDWYK